MQGAAATTPPEWDQRAVAAPYLVALRENLERDALEQGWVDGLFSQLTQELRSVYYGQDVDRALDGLDKLLERYDAAESQRLEALAKVGHQKTSARILDSWRRISRLVFSSRTPSPQQASQNAHNIQTTLSARPADRTQPIRANEASNVAQIAAAIYAAKSNVGATSQVDQPHSRSSVKTKLNAKALKTSTVGILIKLILLSWVAIIWSGLITLPVGIGAGILGLSFIGFFTVPLLATLFGYLRMGAVRDSTLRSMGFQPVPPDHPLAVIAHSYARDLGTPPPKVGTMEVANAFAMGSKREDAVITFGLPMLDMMTPDEVAAIIGHELGHIVSGDMRRMMLMRSFQNTMVCFMIFQRAKQGLRWVICWAAELMILSNSREREFYADAIGAMLAGKQSMISALRKLEGAPPLTSGEKTHARFMARGTLSKMSNMLSTHPSFDARVDALERETYIKKLPRLA